MIKGNKVQLVPAAWEDRESIYEWCFHSETTKSHAGPPDYPQVPLASREEFFNEYHYQACYFTGARSEQGRGFVIWHQGQAVGFISYSCFHLKAKMAELDIWMNSEANCGRGFGTDALVALGVYLKETLGIQQLIMRPSVKNARANQAYKKAGFKISGKSPAEYLLPEYVPVYGEGDYGEKGSALLIKTLSGQ